MHLFRSARFLVLLAPFALLACQSGVHECDDSKDCASGLICIHEHAHDINDDTCQKPCAQQSDCDAGQSCGCPDSPLGLACQTDDEGFSFYCMPG